MPPRVRVMGKPVEFDRDQALAGDQLFRWGNERDREDVGIGGGEGYGIEPGRNQNENICRQ